MGDVLLEDPSNDVPTKKSNLRILIIVGHSNERGGAKNYKNEHEYEFNLRVAKKLTSLLSDEYFITYIHRESGGFSSLLPEIKNFNPDFSIELHFNSFQKPAYGTEVLVYENSKNLLMNLNIADLISDRISREYGFKERGVYMVDDNSAVDGVLVRSEGRGVENLKLVHACGVKYVCILEPVFANFETKESKLIFEDEERYINVLRDCIVYDFVKLIEVYHG